MTRRPPRRRTAATHGHSVARGTPVYAATPRGPVVTGHVVTDRDGRRVLACRRDPARHMLRLPRPAWALDAGALRDAEAAGCDAVRIVTDAGTWEVPLRAWDHGVPVDRGHGAQVALPTDADSWTLTPDGPRPEPEREARPVPVAVSLLAADDMRGPVPAGRWWR